jgi:hypothetical protein
LFNGEGERQQRDFGAIARASRQKGGALDLLAQARHLLGR